MEKKLEKLIPEKVFARDVLGCSPQTVWRMLKRGELPTYITLCGKRYYKPSDIEAWLEARTVNAA